MPRGKARPVPPATNGKVARLVLDPGEAGRIGAVYIVRNPEQLAHLAAQ